MSKLSKNGRSICYLMVAGIGLVALGRWLVSRGALSNIAGAISRQQSAVGQATAERMDIYTSIQASLNFTQSVDLAALFLVAVFCVVIAGTIWREGREG